MHTVVPSEKTIIMETLQLIVKALALGALARQWAPAHDSIGQFYGEMKHHIREHYPAVNLARVEDSPRSTGAHFLLADDLINVAATQDEWLLQKARQLLAAVDEHNPGLTAALVKQN